MKIGIICAGDKEIQPFLPHLENVIISKKAMLTFYEGKLYNKDVVCLYCGVCKTNAAVATQILIDSYKVNIIINAGTAGGMSKDLEIFDFVVATEVAHHDIHESILTEFHPWLSSIFFKTDENLLALAKKVATDFFSLQKVHFGRMVTGEQFITDKGRKEINDIFKPLSVDMETASIAQTCYVNNVPFLAVRVITDTETHSGTDNFELNCLDASSLSKDFVLYILKIMI